MALLTSPVILAEDSHAVEGQKNNFPIDCVSVSDLPDGRNAEEWGMSVAVLEGDLEKVKKLVSRDVNINNLTYGVVTPLHCAAMKGHKEIALYLLLHGADVNKESGKGRTPLWEANFNGQKDVADVLRQHGGVE